MYVSSMSMGLESNRLFVQYKDRFFYFILNKKIQNLSKQILKKKTIIRDVNFLLLNLVLDFNTIEGRYR